MSDKISKLDEYFYQCENCSQEITPELCDEQKTLIYDIINVEGMAYGLDLDDQLRSDTSKLNVRHAIASLYPALKTIIEKGGLKC